MMSLTCTYPLQWTWTYGNAANPNNVIVVGRERHTVSQGKDGRFYVLGGQTATPNNATQPWPYGMADADMDNILIYDVSRGWTKEMMTGDIPSKRWHASSVTCTCVQHIESTLLV